jgi:hypothetical protein
MSSLMLWLRLSLPVVWSLPGTEAGHTPSPIAGVKVLEATPPFPHMTS